MNRAIERKNRETAALISANKAIKKLKGTPQTSLAKGYKYISTSCPISKTVIAGTPNEPDLSIITGGTAIHIRGRKPRFLRDKKIKLSKESREFVNAFDRGLYPQYDLNKETG